MTDTQRPDPRPVPAPDPNTDTDRRRARPPALADQAQAAPSGPVIVRRHSLVTRLWHWSSAGLLVVMLMSGMAIFNAHPRLYWGEYGANPDPAWLEIGVEEEAGFLRVGAAHFDTTGVLGTSMNAQGSMQPRAFPDWATLPSSGDLAGARRWHLTFAWFLLGVLSVYALWSLVFGHLWRNLIPGRSEMTPAHLWRCCKDHAALNFPKGAEARNYNAIQKLTYAFVLLGLFPLIVLTGLCMSPAFNAAVPWLLDLFGGRQSARSIHFITSTLFVLFIIIHVAMVLAAGPWNHIRSMITGRYRLPQERAR